MCLFVLRLFVNLFQVWVQETDHLFLAVLFYAGPELLSLLLLPRFEPLSQQLIIDLLPVNLVLHSFDSLFLFREVVLVYQGDLHMVVLQLVLNLILSLETTLGVQKLLRLARAESGNIS